MSKFSPKQKHTIKFFKSLIFGLAILSLILQSVAAFAIEINPVDPAGSINQNNWGDLANYNHIGRSYADEVVEKIRQIGNDPELFINNQNLTTQEKNQLVDQINQTPNKVLSKNIEDLDTKFENNEFFNNLERADEGTIDVLKQADIISTYLNPETGIETIIDPNLEQSAGHLVTKATPVQVTLPENSQSDITKLDFQGVESDGLRSETINYSVSFDPLNTSRNPVEYSDNIAVYQNQWDNVDVVLTTQPEGVKEDIILKNPSSRQINPQSSGFHGNNNWIFYYRLNLENLAVRENNGQIEFYNSAGSVVAKITSPFMIDNQGEISQNAYYALLTEEDYNRGYQPDNNRFDLTKKQISDETDLSNTVKPAENDLTSPVVSDFTQPSAPVIQSLPPSDFWSKFWGSVKSFFNSTLQLVTKSEAQTVDSQPDADNNSGGLVDELINNLSDVLPDITIDPSGYSTELDQTLPPVEQIGLEDLIKDAPNQLVDNNYQYLALIANTTNLVYPIDIDPSTYILTRSDLINTTNGQLLSNQVSDVKLYDTTLEPTSNYAYNKELKNTLSLNNSIGQINPDNLIALYALDENDLSVSVEDDVTVSAVNGSRIGSPAYVAGQINSALDLNGSSQYVDLADDDKFTLSNNFSISAWINPDNFNTRQPIMAKGTASNWEYNLEITTDASVEFTARALNGTVLYQVTTPVNSVAAGQWSHIIVTRDQSADNLSIYINNNKLATLDSASGNMANGSADLQIGRTAHVSEAFFAGQIDDVRLYGDVLTGNEILNIYENGKSKLVGWWTMTDEADSSGYINHGVITGTSLNNNGQVNISRIFSASDQINLGNNFSLSPSRNLTLESWVKTENYGPIITKQNEYNLEICSDGRPMLMIYANGQWQNNLGTANECAGATYPTINDNSWHHIAGTYDGQYLRLYIDGQIMSNYYFAGSIDRTSMSAFIPGGDYSGEIDEVAVYNRTLSRDELLAHYNQSYATRIANLLNFDQSIDFTEYAQLAFDNLLVTVPGVLQIKGTDMDGNEISEKIKMHGGVITRIISANSYKNITELTALSERGDGVGAKLQIAQGSLKAFSPFHDANWRYGISKVDDRVTGVWHFDEGAGSNAFDSSGTNNTAFLAGGNTAQWLYTREIDLTPATSQDNYPVKLSLDPTFFDYHNAQDDGADLRFYAGTVPLSYYIEKWDNTGESTIWIKIPQSGTSSFSMKYGNPTVDANSNGEDVFPFFDDFTGTTIDTSKWVEFDNGNYLNQNDKIITTSGTGWGSNGLTSVQTFARSNLELNFTYKPTVNGHVMFGWHDSGTGTSYTDLIYAYYDAGGTLDVYEDGNDRTPSLGGSFSIGTTYHIRQRINNTTGGLFQRSLNDGQTYETNYTSSYSSETPLKIGIANHSKGFEIDDLFVRPYQATEPTASLGGLTLNSETYNAQPIWYDTNWSYRTPLYVDNTQNPYDLTNYQLKIGINTSNLVPGNMQADFDDVRFTEDDLTTPINYYYDANNSAANNTVFWLKTNVPAKTRLPVYIYFGNSGASGVSNFDNVFTKDFGETGLRGLWHLDDATSPTVDSSGNGNNATLVNSPTWQGSDGGQFDGDASTNFSTGDHLVLNGSNQYLDAGNTANLKFGGQTITLSAWVKPTTATGYMPIMAQRSGCAGTANWQFYRLSSTEGYVMYFNFWNTSGTNIQSQSSVVIPASVWSHVAVTYDGSFVRFYLNGVLKEIQAKTGSIRSDSHNTYIGTESCGNYFGGSIDEVRILNTVQTADQIKTQYERRLTSNLLPEITTSSSIPNSNIPAWTDNGKFGSALSFDGQNDYLIVPDENSLDAKKQLTVGGWIYPGGLDGWIFSKSLEISPATRLDNLQLKLTLNASNFDYLKANGDGSDLRFADSSGQPISYWIENYDPLGTSEIWLKIPQSGTTKVYMYYGNSGAVSASNFDNTFTKIPVDSGLAGLWHMDDGSGSTTADSSANSNTGNLQSGATWVTSSDGGQWDGRSDVKFSSGSYIAFDGTSNAEIDLGNDSSLQLSTFTFETWIKRSVTGTQDILYSWGSGGPAVYINSGGTLAVGRVGYWEQNSSGTIADTNWHHVAVTYNAPYINFYIDGQLNSTASYATPGFTFGTTASLGVVSDSNTGPINGYLDEARLYNRVLSADEILASYERRIYTDVQSTINPATQESGSPATVSERSLTFSPATSGNNYIVKLNLNSSNFDYTKTRDDGGDIRFYDLSGNALPYYIYQWDPSGTSIVYVKIPTAGTSQINMAYGEKNVYSLSDGYDTLNMFDNFDDGQFDSSTWSRVNDDPLAWNEGADIPGWFKLKALNGKNLSGDDYSAPIILGHQNIASIDYDVYTTVRFDPSTPSAAGQHTGLIVSQDQDNYIEAGIGYSGGDKAYFKIESDNVPVIFENDFTTTAQVDLRINKTGNDYRFYYKDHNSSVWNQHSTILTKELGVQQPGFVSYAGTSPDLTVYYNNFAVIENRTPAVNVNIGAAQDWSYRRNVAIEPATTLDDMQVQLLLDNTFPYANLQAAGQDLRFYDANFNQLNYWIEYWNNASYGNYSSIWIDVPDAGTDQIYMYYGNNSVSAKSNGYRTFPFFDDFTGTTINTSRWVEFDNGNYLSQNDQLIATGGSSAWGSNGLTSVNILDREDLALHFDYTPTATNDLMFGWHDSGTGNSYTDIIYAYYNSGATTVDVYEDGNNRSPSVGGSWNNGTTYKVRIDLNNNAGAIYRRSTDGGMTYETNYQSTYSTETPLKIGISNYNKAFTLDNLFVARQISTSQSVATLSSENSWEYKKTIEIQKNGNPASTPTANYQLKLTITPSDINYDNFNDDGSDLRFFDDNGQSLNYWIERWTKNGTSIVWVNIPDSGTNSLTMYYGNPSATSASNGAGTFEFFDDFNDGQLDTSQWNWTRAVTGTWDEGISREGMLKITALNGSNFWETDNSAPVLATINDFAGQDYELAVQIQASPDEDFQQGGLIVYKDDDNHIQGSRGYSNGQKVTFKKEDSGSASATDANQSDTDIDLRLRKVDNTFRFFYKKHSATTWDEFGSGSELDLTMASQYLGLTAYADGGADTDFYFDDFRVNKINDIDPANDLVGTFATEQTKNANLDEKINIINKGSAFSLGATDTDIFSTLGSQTINAPLDDGWNQVVMTYDGSEQKLYINGDLAVSEPYSGDIAINENEMILGNKFYGFIDDVVVAKTAMSAGQIRDWYNNDQAYSKNQPVENQTQTINPDIVTDNLVGYWPLNEGQGTLAADSSAIGHNGTLTNGPTWVSGQDGFAVNLDGTNDYINVGNYSDYDFEYNQPFSMAAWIKTNSTATQLLMAKNENSGNFRGYYMYITATSGYITTALRSTSTYRIDLTGSTKVNDNQWHHITMTYDGSGLGTGVELYVDGVADTLYTNVDNLQSNTIKITAPLTIGSRASGGTPFAGRIDDARIYNSNLTSSQVAVLANQYNYRFTSEDNVSQSSAINVSGQQYNPTDRLAIKINQSGTAGAASYNVSNDGGLSWSAATYVTSTDTANLLNDGTDTGVDIQFDYGASLIKGDIFQLASWYTEPRSTSRGIRRSFPEVAAIVATDNSTNPYAKSIDIIDTSDNSLWMRFSNSNDGSFLGGGNTSIQGLDMVYGQLFAASADSNNDSIGLLRLNFARDDARYFRNVAQPELIIDNISQRNGGNVMLNDDLMILNDINVNDVDVAMLAGHLVAVAATTGSQGGIAIIDEDNQSVIYGTSGGDDIDHIKLAGNGNLYLSDQTDGNVISLDNILAYDQNFNFNNHNETFGNAVTSTYYTGSTTYQDLAVQENQSIADEFSSDQIYLAGDQGVTLIDTLTSTLADNVNQNNRAGFGKILTSGYITESMNGIGRIRGMWLAGDQTSTAVVSDRSIEANDMTVHGFSSNSLSTGDWDSGVRGPALVFTGDDYLSLNDNSDFDYSNDDNISFGAWVNPALSQTQTIFGQTGNFTLGTSNSSGKVIYEASVSKNSVSYTAMSTEYDLSDVWHYVVGVHDGANDIMQIYIDGQLENDLTTPSQYNLDNPSTAVTIGANSAGGSQFDGRISGVFITANHLTDNQIKRLYNIGAGAADDNSDDLNRIGGASSNINALAVDRPNRKIYIGTADGLTELNLNNDVRTNYWNTATTPALPADTVTSLDFANNKALVATNAGALLIKTDGSYTNSSTVGQLLSGTGNDVFTDGAYNYYVSDNGLDVINLVEQTRQGYVLNEQGFDTVTSLSPYVYMANENGVYRVNVATMSGETTVTYPTYHAGSSIPLPSNRVYDIHARTINGTDYLVVGTDEGLVLIGDLTGDPYRIIFYNNEGDDITKVWLNEAGDLAYYDATDQTVNIFDNAIDSTLYPYRAGTNAYTRRYSATSTPGYIGTTVNDLVYVANTSTAQSNYDTLYIATNNGTSVIQEHSTQSSGTVKHYVSQRLHDDRTGLMLDFDQFNPVNIETSAAKNSINQYDPLRQKFDYLHDPDLAGYWDFDQTLPAKVVDRSGHQNDGGYGPTTGTQGGKLGQGLYFDGRQSYLIVNDDPSLHPTSAFSWLGWVWKDGAISNDAIGQPILASKFDNNNNGEFVLYFNKNDKLQLKVADGTTNVTATESGSVGTNGWHHVAVTFDQGVVRYYIDGALDSEYTVGVTNLALPPYNNVPGSMSDLYLGNDWSVFNNAFGGYLDEVAYYTRALTPEEIQTIYSQPELTDSVTINQYDTLAYRTSANLTTASGAQETFYLNFDETLSGNQGEAPIAAIESEIQRPDLDLISYGGNTNNNIVLDIGSGNWDQNAVKQTEIVKDGSTYKMWYTGSDTTDKIGYATSSDGLHWIKDSANNPVLDLGAGGKFDQSAVSQPTVLKSGNTYHLWYTGNDGVNQEIGYATSTDGVNWTRQNGGDAVLTVGSAGSWDDTDVADAAVIKDGTVYKMWYSGNDGTNYRLGYATSTDGINWTRYDNPNNAACGFNESNDDGCIVNLGTGGLFDDYSVNIGDVLKIDNSYYLIYTGYQSALIDRIGMLTSQNGIDWVRANDGNPILNFGTATTWDDAEVGSPAVIYDANNFKVYYSGNDGTNWRLGLATMDFESGRYGKSLRVENNDIYRYNVASDINRNQGSISFWAKLDSTTDNLHEIFNLQSSSATTQDGLYLALKSGQIIAGYNGEFTLGNNTTLTAANWNHFVLTWEKASASNQNFKLYRNGALIESVPFTNPINTVYDQLQIGGNKNETRDYLDGNIDDFRIYNQALTASDITELYNGSFGVSSKVNTTAKAAEGTIEFYYTTDWDSSTDNQTRTLFDVLGGDPLRVGQQYLDSKTAVNRFRIWKEEGPTLDNGDRLHFGVTDSSGNLYEVYTNETINWTNGTSYKITAQWDLDNNDAAGSGANVMRILVDNTLVAGDNFTTGDTANKKKNGTDTGIDEEIAISQIPELMWIGSGLSNSSINQVNNPSFEENNAGSPADWQTTGSLTYDTSGANARFGTDAVSLTGPDVTNRLQQTIHLIPGTWTMSWYAKGAAADSTQDIDVQISAGGLTGTTGDNTDPGTAYQYYKITFANDTPGDLTITLAANNGETVWFDGLTLVAGRMEENYQSTSSSYKNWNISNYLLTQSALTAEYLAETYDSTNKNASLAGETNNATAVAVKKISTSTTASDDIMFVGTKGAASEGAVTQITFGSPDQRTNEYRQDTTGTSLTSNRINAISYSTIRNNLAIATDDAGVFGFFDDVSAQITLTSPNGTEEWEGGSSHDITWTVDVGECDHVDLFYTINSGASYEDIALNLTGTNSYTWNPVDEINSSNVLVKAACKDPFGAELATDLSDSTMIIDSTSPVFSLYNVPNPSGDSVIYGRGSGTDSGGATSITEVQYKVDTDDWQPAVITSGSGTTSVEFDFSTAALDAGSHTIYVKGRDSSLPGGNETDLSSAASRTFNVDELSISFDKDTIDMNLSVTGSLSLTDSIDVTVTGYGTDYSLAIKADQPPTNRYYPTATIPFYTGNDAWAGADIGFGWKYTGYNSGNYNDFQTGSYEVFKNSIASLLGDTTTVDFKAAIDWTVAAGDYDSTVSIVVIPRY